MIVICLLIVLTAVGLTFAARTWRFIAQFLRPLPRAVSGALVWALVGPSVSCAFLFPRVFTWALFIVAPGVPIAAIAGALHSEWFWHPRGKPRPFDWVAAGITGALAGLTCFLPVCVIWQGTQSRLSAILGVTGAVAGGAISAMAALSVSPARPRLGRYAAGTAGVVAILGLTVIVFGGAVMDRMPVWEVSSKDVSNLPAGDAVGAKWSGCYSYHDQAIPNSYGLGLPKWKTGTSGGQATLKQFDGRLEMALGGTVHRGGINRDGTFWVGYETPDVRIRIDGHLRDGGFTYQRRGTARRSASVNTVVQRGEALRCR